MSEPCRNHCLMIKIMKLIHYLVRNKANHYSAKRSHREDVKLVNFLDIFVHVINAASASEDDLKYYSI